MKNLIINLNNLYGVFLNYIFLMLNKKELTVIIPFYKKMDKFYKTYLSLKNQSYKNFKTIIVYDDEEKKI